MATMLGTALGAARSRVLSATVGATLVLSASASGDQPVMEPSPPAPSGIARLIAKSHGDVVRRPCFRGARIGVAIYGPADCDRQPSARRLPVHVGGRVVVRTFVRAAAVEAWVDARRMTLSAGRAIAASGRVWSVGMPIFGGGRPLFLRIILEDGYADWAIPVTGHHHR
jgi:hypothetical protein